MLPEANTRRQEAKYPIIQVLWGCILKLVFILYTIGDMQSTILLSFIISSSLLPCGLQSTHPPLPCYISPYVPSLATSSDTTSQKTRILTRSLRQHCRCVSCSLTDCNHVLLQSWDFENSTIGSLSQSVELRNSGVNIEKNFCIDIFNISLKFLQNQYLI